MNTVEDFENAPIGATATHDGGSRAIVWDLLDVTPLYPKEKK